MIFWMTSWVRKGLYVKSKHRVGWWEKGGGELMIILRASELMVVTGVSAIALPLWGLEDDH